MRFLIALIALPAALLSGCTTLTLSNPDELYLATDYAPRPLTAKAVDLAKAPAIACDARLGVEALHGIYPNTNVEFRVLPGMTLAVEQTSGRLSGASDLPIISRWSWRVPNTADSGCSQRLRWSHGDVAIARSLLYGAQASVGTTPPPGDAGTATAWGLSVQCLLGPKPEGTKDVPDACGDLPVVEGDALLKGLYQPFSRGLGFRLRPNRGPLNGTGLAQQITLLSARNTSDAPTTTAEWKQALNCEDPSHWASSNNPWPDCRPPFKSLVFSKALAEATGTTGGTKIALAPVLRRNLTLLESGDPLFLSAPRPVQALASPSFDLSSGAPGTGGGSAPPAVDAGAQRPLAGEAYQGFVSIDVMIPIRIRGQSEPVLVPISTTAATLHDLLGREILAIGRLGQWLPERVSVRDKHECRFTKARAGEPPRPTIANCALIRANSVRTFFRFDRGKGSGRFIVAPEDLLLAPGDLVVVR